MKIMFILMLSLLCTSCVETLIAGAVYKSSKTRQAKQAFMADFNQANIDREKAGLPPLDLCTEQYHFDKKWADNDPVCAERIVKYEAGDTTALGHPELELTPPQSTPSPEPTPKTQASKTEQ